MNDLEILSGYEHSIAMENGEERVKNAAGFITLDNDSNGIIYGLSKYLDKYKISPVRLTVFAAFPAGAFCYSSEEVVIVLSSLWKSLLLKNRISPTATIPMEIN